MAESSSREVRAPRGSTLSCRGWQQEAALRMLMNNLDPEVAERPADLVVYGGTGKAARSWSDFDAIVAELRRLGDDETLLVQSGRPVGVFRTHADAPRVLLANSNLVPAWATWEHFRELEARGLADPAVDDELLRLLRDVRVEVVLQHPQRGLLLPAAAAQRLGHARTSLVCG